MKTKTFLSLLFLILFASLSGCSAGSVPPATEAQSPTSLPATETNPLVIDTVVVPSPTAAATAAEMPTEAPTAAAPADTAEATAATPAGATAAATAEATVVETTTTTQAAPAVEMAFLPQEGLWGGGARDLIITFVIGRQGAAVTLSELSIVWFSPHDCALDHKLTDVTLFDGDEFTRTMVVPDIRYTLTGKLISATEISGKFDLSYKGCGSADVNWWAIPKP